MHGWDLPSRLWLPADLSHCWRVLMTHLCSFALALLLSSVYRHQQWSTQMRIRRTSIKPLITLSGWPHRTINWWFQSCLSLKWPKPMNHGECIEFALPTPWRPNGLLLLSKCTEYNLIITNNISTGPQVYDLNASLFKTLAHDYVTIWWRNLCHVRLTCIMRGADF